jgi:hypothetical protein
MTRISQCGQLVPTLHPIRMSSVQTGDTYLVRLPTTAEYCMAFRADDGTWRQASLDGCSSEALGEEPSHVWLVEIISVSEIDAHALGEVE